MAGFFARLKQGLSKTRGQMSQRIDELAENTRLVDDDFFEELTDILLLADTGAETTDQIISQLRERAKREKIRDAKAVKEMLKAVMIEEMNIPRPPLRWPMVMLVVGVNGVGKTTTVGKLALRFREVGRSVVLAAADTFRAAADEQLQVWAQRADVLLVHQQQGADPAAVVYDAIQSAKAKGTDLLIVDTAGRLHNKKNLMDELCKIRRVIAREAPDAVCETLLVIDATTGQNAVQQAKVFREVAAVTGLAITKLDGNAKGGVAIAVAHQTRTPLVLAGLGEGLEDLTDFDPDAFVDALLPADS